MTQEDVSSWVLRYHASVGETPTPTLDQAILAAAGRHLAARRTARRLTGVSVMAAFALLAIISVWPGRQPGLEAQFTATGYGRFEGISRRYLMEVETVRFTGFGINEGSP